MKRVAFKLAVIVSLFLITTGVQSCKKSNSSVANTPRTDITADLAGSPWFALDEVNMDNTLNYTLTVYNTSNGVWFNKERDPWDMRPRPGNGISFTAKGDFEICKFTNAGMGGCKSYGFFYMKGSAEQNSDEIKLHPVRHRNTYYSTCDPTLNYDKELEKTSVKFKWTITRYNNHWDQLNITWDHDRSTSTFYRKW